MSENRVFPNRIREATSWLPGNKVRSSASSFSSKLRVIKNHQPFENNGEDYTTYFGGWSSNVGIDSQAKKWVIKEQRFYSFLALHHPTVLTQSTVIVPEIPYGRRTLVNFNPRGSGWSSMKTTIDKAVAADVSYYGDQPHEHVPAPNSEESINSGHFWSGCTAKGVCNGLVGNKASVVITDNVPHGKETFFDFLNVYYDHVDKPWKFVLEAPLGSVTFVLPDNSQVVYKNSVPQNLQVISTWFATQHPLFLAIASFKTPNNTTILPAVFADTIPQFNETWKIVVELKPVSTFVLESNNANETVVYSNDSSLSTAVANFAAQKSINATTVRIIKIAHLVNAVGDIVLFETGDVSWKTISYGDYKVLLADTVTNEPIVAPNCIITYGIGLVDDGLGPTPPRLSLCQKITNAFRNCFSR
jgi:hypothetical protein